MGRAKTNHDKERVCLYVDKEVVALFKHVAEIEERPYQPLMNKVLRDYYDALPDDKKLIRQDR
jgi:uncharacterized protein (DUF4415 family)